MKVERFSCDHCGATERVSAVRLDDIDLDFCSPEHLQRYAEGASRYDVGALRDYVIWTLKYGAATGDRLTDEQLARIAELLGLTTAAGT